MIVKIPHKYSNGNILLNVDEEYDIFNFTTEVSITGKLKLDKKDHPLYSEFLGAQCLTTSFETEEDLQNYINDEIFKQKFLENVNER